MTQITPTQARDITANLNSIYRRNPDEYESLLAILDSLCSGKPLFMPELVNPDVWDSIIEKYMEVMQQ